MSPDASPTRPEVSGTTAWTVGHSDRTLEDLIALLASAGIGRLADVRSYPKSRLPWFHHDVFAAGLAGQGIDYEWLGRDLGGLRHGGYRAWMAADGYARGIAELEMLATTRPTVVCCAERDPERCHRRFIADTLVDRGWRVIHLIGPHEALEHTRLPRQDGLPF